MLPKIQQIRKLIKDQGLTIDIEVDGGINLENARIVASAGADILVAGNAVFNGPAPTVAENINLLKNAALE
jgi:ribulose-phosphate 3-epimerase